MTGLLLGLTQAWWHWCAAVSIQAAVVFVVVAVLDRILRARVGPGTLEALWFLVVVKFFVPPTLASPLSVSNLWDGPSLLAPPLPPAGTPAAAAFFVWLAGCALFGLACLWRCRNVRREWLGDAPEPVPAALEASCRDAAARLGLKCPPEIRIGSSGRGPAVVGFLRTVVVLPARLIETSGPEEIAHVLLHEFAHVKRRDPLRHLACLLVQLVFWFHPCAWLARRRWSELAELGCDQRVAAALGGSTAGYRRTLLGLARSMLAPGQLGSLGFFRRRAQLPRRIEGLIRLERGCGGKGRRLLQRIVAGGLFALVLVSCMPLARPRAADVEPTALVPNPLQGCLQLRYVVHAALARQRIDPDAKPSPTI